MENIENSSNESRTLQDPKVRELFNKIHVLRQHWTSQQTMDFEGASYEKLPASTRLEADCFEDTKGCGGVVPTTFRSNSTHSMSSASSDKDTKVAESPAGTDMNFDIEMTEEQRKELEAVLADLHALKINTPEPESCPYFSKYMWDVMLRRFY